MAAARKIVSRHQAGLPPPKRSRAVIVEPEGIALHYSGSLGDVKRDHQACYGVLLAYYEWHTRPGGLGVDEGGSDIAYNWVICPHGYRFVCRGRRYQSGANGTRRANETFYACCVMGGDKAGRRDVTPEARTALEDLYRQIGREIRTVRRAQPHSSFVSTGCPGDELRALLPRLRVLLRSG